MPALQCQIEGRGNGIRTSILNVKDVAAAIHRKPEYVVKYFGCELGAQSNYTENEREGVRATVMGKHDFNMLQDLLDKFLHTFVLCPTCGLPEMALKVKKDDIYGQCKACGFSDFLGEATSHKVALLICKMEKEAAKKGDGGGGKKLTKEERKAAKAA